MAASFYALNLSTRSLKLIEGNPGESSTIKLAYLSGRPRPIMRPGDRVLLGMRTEEQVENGIFDWVGKVESIEEEYFPSDGDNYWLKKGKWFDSDVFFENEKNIFVFTIKMEEEIEDPLSVFDLRYSLTVVSRFDQPWRHFVRSIRELPRQDFQTFREKRFFLSRSAFGEIFSALPNSLRRQFLYQVLQENSLLSPSGLSYALLLEQLKRFIEGQVMERGRLLRASRDILEQSFGEIAPIEDIGFRESVDEVGDSLVDQAELFDVLEQFAGEEGEFPEQSFWDYLKGEVNQANETEEQFGAIFKGIAWPVDIQL